MRLRRSRIRSLFGVIGGGCPTAPAPINPIRKALVGMTHPALDDILRSYKRFKIWRRQAVTERREKFSGAGCRIGGYELKWPVARAAKAAASSGGPLPRHAMCKSGRNSSAEQL
jgi:hypothetical protein